MSDEEWTPVHAVLTTSQAIEAYGGFQFPPEFLERAARDFNSGALPMHVAHDETRRLRIRGLHTWVERRSDGVHLLKATFEIHRDDAHLIESMQGMSVSVTTPLGSRQGALSERAASTIVIAADHAWFSDDAIEEAESVLIAALPQGTPVDAERVYQFSFIPDPQIFIDIDLPSLKVVAGSIAGGVAGNAVYDVIKRLIRRRTTPAGADPDVATRVTFEVTDGERAVKAAVYTADEAVALRALNDLPTAAARLLSASAASDSLPAPVVWDDQGREWVPPR